MKLFYRHYGTGAPLFILHGLFGMSDNWTTLAKHFGEHGFSVYAIDLRNHGQSPHSDAFSYELMVADVIELIDTVLPTPHSQLPTPDSHLPTPHSHLPTPYSPLPTILGHSMGGKVAMMAALNHPDKIEKLIVADMAPRYYPPHHQNIFAAMHALGDMSVYTSRKEVEQKLAQHLTSPATLQFILKNLYWKKTDNGEVLAWRFNLPAIERNVEDMSVAQVTQSTFTKPTLFIKGEKSTYITSADEPEIKKLFPNVIFKTIPDAGHWVHADKPKEFFEAVMEFAG